MLRKKTSQKLDETMSLMVAILLNFPEVGNIHYLAQNSSIKFAFIIGDHYPQETLNAKIGVLNDAIYTYHNLQQVNAAYFKLAAQSGNGYCHLTIARDMHSFSVAELRFVVDMLYLCFEDNLLVTEEIDLNQNYDFPDDMMDYFFARAKTSTHNNGIIAYREEGRVMVFNK